MRTGPALALFNFIAATLCAVLVLVSAGTITMRTLFHTLHVCTAIGAVWFLVAFVARPLHDLHRSDATRWLVKHRRYLGLSFAAWHLQHLWLLPMLGWTLGPMRFLRGFYRTGNLIPATITLLLIVAMTVTSTDRAQRALGNGWKWLHRIGIYAIWFWMIFMFWHGYRKDPRAYVAVILAAYAVVMAVRVLAFVRRAPGRAPRG